MVQKLSSLRTSLVAMACGVVTRRAPARWGVFVGWEVGEVGGGVVVERRVSAREMCSSEVPGGVSMRR